MDAFHNIPQFYMLDVCLEQNELTCINRRRLETTAETLLMPFLSYLASTFHGKIAKRMGFQLSRKAGTAEMRMPRQ